MQVISSSFCDLSTVVFITLRDWIQRHSNCEPYRAIPMKATSVTHVRLVPSVFEMAPNQDSSDSIFVLRCRPVFHPVSAAACLTFSATSALQLNSNLSRIRQGRHSSQRRSSRHQNCGSEGVTGFVTCERKVSFVRLSERYQNNVTQPQTWSIARNNQNTIPHQRKTSENN